MRCERPSSFETTDPKYAIKPNAENKILWHVDEEHVSDDLEKFKIIAQFQKAFNIWQKYFGSIVFETTSDITKAPIVLRFMDSDNPKLPSPFGSNTLAYAYYPNRESLGIHSDIYFNDKYNWAEMHSAGTVNLFKVAVHELGHAFGIEHNRIKADIMYPTYQPNDYVNITKDTRDAIDHLYSQYKNVTPSAEIDVVTFINELFANPDHLENLTEIQLLTIGKVLEADVNINYLKKDNIENIRELLKV